MSERELVVLTTTFADQEKAESVAALIVDAGLAVCAQVGGAVVSFYRFEGTMQKEQEIPVTFKILPVRLDLFLGELKLQHPYKVPQIVGWSAPHVDADYLQWAEGKTS